MSDTIESKTYHTKRLAAISEGKTPVPLNSFAILVFHVAPRSALGKSPVRYDISKFTFSNNIPAPLAYFMSTDTAIFHDRVIKIYRYEDHAAYTQVFRDGIAEGAMNLGPKNQEFATLSGSRYESKIIKFLNQYMAFADEFNILPPYYACLSFVNVQGYQLSFNDVRVLSEKLTPLSKKMIHPKAVSIPDLESQDNKGRLGELLRPIFDTVSIDFRGSVSESYDNEGNWIGESKLVNG